jgi:hypothetical protein
VIGYWGTLVGPVRRGARVAAAVVATHCADGWSAEGGHDKHGTDSPDDSDARSEVTVCLSVLPYFLQAQFAQ